MQGSGLRFFELRFKGSGLGLRVLGFRADVRPISRGSLQNLKWPTLNPKALLGFRVPKPENP